MAEHNHTKILDIRERIEASAIRQSINETTYRIETLWNKYRAEHNSGYCAYELQPPLVEIKHSLKILNDLVEDLGKVEHYNFESALAQLEVINERT